MQKTNHNRMQINERIFIATQILSAFIARGVIKSYDGDLIVRRDPITDRKITATEDQEESITQCTRIAYKIADVVLQYGYSNGKKDVNTKEVSWLE